MTSSPRTCLLISISPNQPSAFATLVFRAHLTRGVRKRKANFAFKCVSFVRSVTAVTSETREGSESFYWTAPEVMTMTEHGYSADYWSLGCLIYFISSHGKALVQLPQEARDEMLIYRRLEGHSPLMSHLIKVFRRVVCRTSHNLFSVLLW